MDEPDVFDRLLRAQRRPSWADVEAGARHDPYLQAAVAVTRTGEFSREEALIAVLLAMSASRASLLATAVRALANRPPRPPHPTVVDAAADVAGDRP